MAVLLLLGVANREKDAPGKPEDAVAPTPAKVLSEFSRPHVIVISIDTLRPDYLGLNGHPWVKSPCLDAFAQESVVFEKCVATAPTTAASHMSLFTGTFPHTHGVARNGYTLHPGNVTLAEVLHDHGYYTTAVIGGYPLAARFGFDQGYDQYDDTFTRERRGLGGTGTFRGGGHRPRAGPGRCLGPDQAPIPFSALFQRPRALYALSGVPSTLRQRGVAKPKDAARHAGLDTNAHREDGIASSRGSCAFVRRRDLRGGPSSWPALRGPAGTRHPRKRPWCS